MISDKIFFTLLLVLLGFNGNTQTLTYKDIKYVFENDVEKADSYIVKKGFRYHETKGKTMLWSYNRNVKNNKATAFIGKFETLASQGTVWYQCEEIKTFQQIKADIKKIGYKQQKTEFDDKGQLCTTFENSKYSIEFCSGMSKDSNINTYTVLLSLKE